MIYKTFQIAVMFLLIASSAPSAKSYVIITNKGNDISIENPKLHEELKAIFLKKRTRWSTGLKANPFDRWGDSEEHAVLLDELLNMDKANYKHYWTLMKQKTGDIPPVQIKSLPGVIRKIASQEGAVTIIAASAAEKFKDDIKILLTFNDE